MANIINWMGVIFSLTAQTSISVRETVFWRDQRRNVFCIIMKLI